MAADSCTGVRCCNICTDDGCLVGEIMKKRQIIELTAILLALVACVVVFEVLPRVKKSYPSIAGDDEYRMPFSAWGVNGHAQGACSDGTYVWWSCGDLIAKSTVDNPDWENPLAINDHARTDGTPSDQINGICLHDGYIYAAAPTFTDGNVDFYVKWYDMDTLVFAGEQQLSWTGGADTQEGISWSNGYWWVCYYDAGYVTKYTVDWVDEGNYNLPGNPKQIQGLDWVNDQLWVTTSATSNITVYTFNDGKFSRIGEMNMPGALGNEQSFGVTPDEKYLWIAGFTKDSQWELLFKLELKW